MAVELPQRRSLPRLLLPLLIAIVVFGALAVSQLRGSEQGIGEQKPVVTIASPTTAEAGSVQTVSVTVQNPAASDIESLFVSFSALAVAGGEDFPTPIVAGRIAGVSSPIVDIEPKPVAQGEGVRFGFGPLEAGQTTTIRFELRMPEATGPAANSVAVYDGTLPERASGASIEITIES
ncbi:MAG: hypothetical protein M3198_05620 [Actinomycetota bacterium]|nr:hypothetical protein [Actinomycetota bacterium]